MTGVKPAACGSTSSRFKTNDPDATAALAASPPPTAARSSPPPTRAAVAAAFQTSAGGAGPQVQFTVQRPDRPLSGAQRWTLTGRPAATPFAASAGRSTFGAAPRLAPTPYADADPRRRPGCRAAAGRSRHGSLRSARYRDRLVAVAARPRLFFVLWPPLIADAPDQARAARRRDRALRVGEPARSPGRGRTQRRAHRGQLLDMGDRVMKDRKSTSKTMALIERADLPFRAASGSCCVSSPSSSAPRRAGPAGEANARRARRRRRPRAARAAAGPALPRRAPRAKKFERSCPTS